jgi:hypothetical protein
VREDRFDEEMKAFLRRHVQSHDHLEVLLLLHRHRDEYWSSNAVAEKLRISRTAAREAIDHLVGNGLLSEASGSHPSFRYGPASKSLEIMVDRLIAVCEEDRPGVILRMNANAIDRVRSAAIRLFGKAFRSKR